MKKFLLSALLAAASVAAGAQTARQFTLPLSDDGVAQLVVYLPEQPTGRAVVCCPGGGYAVLSNTHEGAAWSEFFNAKGIAFALVNYRIPHGDRTLPIGDTEQAMRMMRDSAAVWHLNPRDIGIMGSSAGGHLASTIATHTPYELRPDFQILVYPVITMGPGTHQGSLDGLLGDEQKNPDLVRLYSNQFQVKTHQTPPAIIILSDDDGLVPPVPKTRASAARCTCILPAATATATCPSSPTGSRCSPTSPPGWTSCPPRPRTPSRWPVSATASPTATGSTSAT